ncbi:DUF1178 family protein [uncultured Oxalicibacterium sp.]|uniref:DUF1178 family protein n=1 Tax=uncultured Oxalicibacterium sp. TaxID=1168540 RepID=UPI0025CDC181|nr:DUF1178 family protein [uncultured Oxalicibacterium sp.]
MKVYDLCCEHSHRFEGWFASESDFQTQSEGALIGCPFCGSHGITRLPSTPRLNLSQSARMEGGQELQNLQQAYLHAIQQILASTEDVGTGFAEEARRIYYNEAPERAIRGITTVQEREALADEGIDVLSIPMPDVAKQTLQ